MGGQPHPMAAARREDAAEAGIFKARHGRQIQLLEYGPGLQTPEYLFPGPQHSVVGAGSLWLHMVHDDSTLIFHIVPRHPGPAHGHGQIPGLGHISCGTVTAIVEALVGHAPDHQRIDIRRLRIREAGDLILWIFPLPELTHGILPFGGRLGLARAAVQRLDGSRHAQVHQLTRDPAHPDLVGILDQAKAHRVSGNIHTGRDPQLVLQAFQEIHAGVVAFYAYGEALAQKLPKGVHGIQRHRLRVPPFPITQDLVHCALVHRVVIADAVHQKERVVLCQDKIGDMADDDRIEVAEIKHILRTHEDRRIQLLLTQELPHVRDTRPDIASQLRASVFLFYNLFHTM